MAGYAKKLKPSKRNELEITELNQMYLDEGRLSVQVLGREFTWIDTGTIDSLYEASSFVKMIQDRQRIEIAAPEEIAYINGWITKERLMDAAVQYGASIYGKHLRGVAEGKYKL